MSDVEAETSQASSTLASLYADLGADIFEIVEAPRGGDVAVTGVTIRDPSASPPDRFRPGDLILAVGVAADPRALAPVLEEAGRDRAAAIVVRGAGSTPPGLIEPARKAGIAIAVLERELAWNRFYDLVQAALAVGAEPLGPDAGRAEVRDLFALADATAELAGGPVSIEDPHSRVLAFSRGGQDVDAVRAATILHRSVPEELLQEMRRVKLLKRLHSSTEPLTIALQGQEQRRVIAVHGGGQVLGSIWVAGDPRRLAPEIDDILRGAARIAAFQMMHRQATDDVERRLREGRLQALLRGEPAGEGVLADLGLDSEPGLVVAAIEVGEPAAANAVALHDRLSGMLRIHLAAFRRTAAITGVAGRVYAVLSCRDADDRERLRQTLEDGLARAERVLGEPLHGGLSVLKPVGFSLAELRHSADQALSLNSEPGRVAPFEKVHSRALVADVIEFLSKRRPAPEIRLLKEQDDRHGTDYIKTLRAYLDALGDSQAAGRALGVHANTVRYRVRRAHELTGIDFEDGDSRFAFELQLRMLPEANPPAESEST